MHLATTPAAGGAWWIRWAAVVELSSTPWRICGLWVVDLSDLGDRTVPFGDRLAAVPLTGLWANYTRGIFSILTELLRQG